MELSKQVVSLELSKRLKELDVKQYSIFCWSDTETVPKGREFRIYYKGINVEGNKLDYAAFTVAELGEMICWEKLYIFGTPSELLKFIDGKNTEADARAQILIHLLENKILTNKRT